MKKPRSLHSRLILGVSIWGSGVVMAGFAVAVTVMRFHPRQALIIHDGLIALIGAVVVTAGVSVIRRVMSPFNVLHDRLVAMRDGRASRLQGEYPAEVQPLVDDLNKLLDDRERRVERAVARAGDLAHGLKTPLAVLLQDVDRIESTGQHELASSMRQQVERMRRHITSHLAQARATAGTIATSARAGVADAAHALVRTMERIYAERSLTLRANVAPGLVVRVPLEELEEMLGNLLDNACKWATSRITVSAQRIGGNVVITIDDDGTGLEASMRQEVLRRGVRADESAAGSGLGLAIVRDLADAYGGSIRLDRSAEGGLRAQLTLPAAD